MSDKKNKDTNREYKDRLFKFIFGNPENKEWTLSLYNAINGTAYETADDIQLTTIQDAVYMKMKNDVSFLINNIMNFYEQQSTFVVYPFGTNFDAGGEVTQLKKSVCDFRLALPVR